MDATSIIDSYVSDVVHYLPRRQRGDVARELRSLLDDELGGRAEDAGRPADTAMTMALLTGFGRPQDVADRYRPAGFTVIRPSEAPRFAGIALGGVALVWGITLPAALLGITPVVGWDYGAGTWWGRLTAWWLGPGLGAFWWPGVMITFALIAALVGRRRESRPTAWAPARPRTVDRDLVSRPAMVSALALWLLGATVVVALPWIGSWAPGLPHPVVHALALDPDFLRWRAPWVLAVWAATFALHVVVLAAGRWSSTPLLVRGVLDVLILGLMLWWVLGGQILVTEAGNGTVKLVLAVLSVVAAIDAIFALRRGSSTARPKP